MVSSGKMARSCFLLAIVALWLPSYQARSLLDEFYDRVQLVVGQRWIKPISRRPVVTAGWPRTWEGLGEVCGVAIWPSGDPLILHRGPHHWDDGAFNETKHYQRKARGPIAVDPVLLLDGQTGAVVESWGSGQLYLPHGITVDDKGYTWITDVAMHQVFKFSPRQNMVGRVGTPFEPGVGRYHFCQPTAVLAAPEPYNEVYVADGYCNSRIVLLAPDGRYLSQLPRSDEFLSLEVPHGLTLVPYWLLLCIADRDNMRVVCPRSGLRGYPDPFQPFTIQAPDLGRVFAVAATDGLVYAVNGPTSPRIPVRGFTMDIRTESVVDRWGIDEGFETPHALASSFNGTVLYMTELSPPRVWRFDLLLVHDGNGF